MLSWYAKRRVFSDHYVCNLMRWTFLDVVWVTPCDRKCALNVFLMKEGGGEGEGKGEVCIKRVS